MERLERARWCLLLALGLLTLRLAHLQLVRGGMYRQLAEQNRLRLVPEPAPRGLIVDRRGRIMATSQTLFRVAIVPQELQDLRQVLQAVSRVVHREVPALQRAYTQERGLAFVPATVVARVPKEAAIRLEEERWRLPGLLVKPETVRYYPLGASAAHVLGYLSQPTADELPLLKQYGVRPTQLIGRTGLERLLDHALQGRGGGVMVEVNHRARQVRVLGQRAPAPGAKVAVTLDSQLESLIEQLFAGQPGACVVLDPITGAVLAMVSVPGFAPEAFAAAENRMIRQWFSDPLTPMMNRASSGVYLPGSIMKLITAAAGLESGVITPETQIACPGFVTLGDRTIHCWNRDGHGPMTLRQAITQSCNVYFMQVARRLGRERLLAAQREAGFSRPTGWPLGEQAGHLPQRRITEGELALLGIGQGEILVTPLQAAVMVSLFANRGGLVTPWLVDTVDDRPVDRPGIRRHLRWNPATVEAIRLGMRGVVNDPAGTGHRAMSTLVTVSGKTGTAQTHVEGQTHGWFAGFCPVDEPRAAFAIVVEYGGSGGELPADVAKSICEYVSLPGALEAAAPAPQGAGS